MELQELLEKAKEYLTPDKITFIQEAYGFAARSHEGQRRLSGEPFIQHPLQTAYALASIQLDAATLAAALLHDVPEDCGVPLEELEKTFGVEVARLVDGVTKLSKIEGQAITSPLWSKHSSEEAETQAANLRKMLMAMAQDVRVVIIKLADRLHNMRTLQAQPPDRQQAIAQETLDIYAPLAHRLGMWEFKWQLEDLALRHLMPEKYREISRLLATKRAERESFVNLVTQTLKEELEKAGIASEVTGRPKHIYSIYRKAERYAQTGKQIADIFDLFAVRVLVNGIQECYSALGIIHSLWHPIPGQIDDYIANPKENGYQSLHTTVMYPGGIPLEIQVRSHRMHHVAEYGVAAHWKYKEGESRDVNFEERMTWLRQLLEWQREVSKPEDFLESLKTDLFPEQVLVFTPKGQIIELQAGATPVDFAYRIHTDLGHRCIGAKVNGRLVSLDHTLKNGDTVEVLASKLARGPSLDWLNSDLGYLKTAGAREKVRLWFRRREKTENIQRGKELLQKELRRLGIPFEQEETLPEFFKYQTLDDLYAALGSGGLTVHQISAKFTAPKEPARPSATTPFPKTETASGVQVLGVGDLLTRISQCCNPLPGDNIIGFITRSRGVSIHRKDCKSLQGQEEKERLVQVDWGPTQQLYPVRIKIDAWDRVGLLRDITTVVSDEKVNMTSVVSTESPDHTCSIALTLHTTGIAQLSRLMSKLEGVKGIFSVSRHTGPDEPLKE